jgi:hypothetical protein
MGISTSLQFIPEKCEFQTDILNEATYEWHN